MPAYPVVLERRLLSGVCLILLLLLRVGKEVFSLFFADFMSHIVILEFYKTDCIGNVLLVFFHKRCLFCFVHIFLPDFH